MVSRQSTHIHVGTVQGHFSYPLRASGNFVNNMFEFKKTAHAKCCY